MIGTPATTPSTAEKATTRSMARMATTSWWWIRRRRVVWRRRQQRAGRRCARHILDGSAGWGVADYRNAHTSLTVRLDGSGNAGDEAAGDAFANINGMFESQYGDTIAGNANGNWIIACGQATILSRAASATTPCTAPMAERTIWTGRNRTNDVLYGGNGQETC